MNKSGLLHDDLSMVIAMLGHKDTIVISDAGLPIPDTTLRIDLAVRCGTPPFLDVLEVVLQQLAVESAIVTKETAKESPDMDKRLREKLGQLPVETIKHDELKERSKTAKAVVRTGECTPYSNVILVAGVTF